MKAGHTTLNEFLKKPIKMSIPIYQRKYSWSLNECRQLFEDIISIGGEEDIKSHFIGSIVVKTEGNPLIGDIDVTLIDGQQRIATLTLIYCALCNYYKNIDEKLCTYFYRNYLINSDLEESVKLTLTKDDNESLKYIINSTTTNQEFNLNRDKSINIYKNYEFFREHITEDNVQLVIDGLNRIVFVSIVLDQTDNPQLIFESLNSKGLDLNKNDLIRNYILMELKTNEQNILYENYWSKIEEIFKGHEKFFDEFIRYYLSLDTGNLPKKADLYKEFKKHTNKFEKDDDLPYEVRKFKKAEAVVADVYKFAVFFSRIRFGKEEDPDLKEAFDSLYELDFNVTLPFLLTVYNDYENALTDPDININRDEFIKIIQIVESYCLRRSICDIPTNSMQNMFARLAKEINKKEYYNYFIAALLNKEFNRRFPTNDEVKENVPIQNMFEGKKHILKHLLLKIENSNEKDVANRDDYTLEHIMPQELTREWEIELGPNYEEIHKKYLHTIGNITLIPFSTNAGLGNMSFQNKKTDERGFDNSRLDLNIYLSNLDNWTEKEILERAEVLSKPIIDIWKYPVKTARISEIMNMDES